MASFTKGKFTIDLGIVKLGGDLTDEDRQCAWELYAEIATRVAVSGKRGDKECTDFNGELYVESLNSLYTFFGECRQIMKKFPVGRIPDPSQRHLGCVIHRLLADVLRPFLEMWQVKFRTWWDSDEHTDLTPFERQKNFPDEAAFLEDWSNVRQIVRELEHELIKTYKLVDLEPEKKSKPNII